MRYHERQLKPVWLAATRQFPVLMLNGPRQVGKTTFLEKMSGRGRSYVSLDDLSVRRLAREEPRLFLERYPPPVVIDEIQYVPELLTAIKQNVDGHKKPGAFWLTGSQPFHLMKGVTESLAGRVAIMNMSGFSAHEKNRRVGKLKPFLPTPALLRSRPSFGASARLASVYKDIWGGGFPALATGEVRNHQLFFSSYVQTYLQRDVRDLTQVGDLEVFGRFLKACAARTGQLLNISDLARDTDVSVNTARHWLSILEASFVIYLLKPFHSNFTKRLVKAPKLYFLDTGLCAYLTEWTSPGTLESGAMAGAFLETYVVGEILKSWWNNAATPSLYYYRDKDGREIDLVLQQDDRLYPVEIKKSASPKPEWTKHFNALSRFSKGPIQGAVVCMVSEPFPLDPNTSAVPVSCI
jgi:predicted AAA+ superfamily ATPase